VAGELRGSARRVVVHWVPPGKKTAACGWWIAPGRGTQELSEVNCGNCLPAVKRMQEALRPGRRRELVIDGLDWAELQRQAERAGVPADAAVAVRRMDCGCCSDSAVLEWFEPACGGS
jgi:hypothetical protein